MSLSPFSCADLRRRDGWSYQGERCRIPASLHNTGHRFTMTVMSSLTHPRGYLASPARRDTNTSVDFFLFIIRRIHSGDLRPGDILVCDNARVHTAHSMLHFLLEIFDAFQIKLVLLPTYSPELNPVELIWGFVKNQLRLNRRVGAILEQDLEAAFALLSWANVRSFYAKCVQ